jgi:hypothetical protein
MRRRSRRYIDELMHELNLARKIDMRTLCRVVGERLNRPVRLLRVEMPPELPSGLVVVADSQFTILVDSLAHPFLQDGIACHELAHLLLNHHVNDRGDDAASRLMLPTLQPWAVEHGLRGVEQALARTCYDDRAERDAEILGTELFSRLNPWPAEQTWDVPPDAARVITQIERALGEDG